MYQGPRYLKKGIYFDLQFTNWLVSIVLFSYLENVNPKADQEIDYSRF